MLLLILGTTIVQLLLHKEEGIVARLRENLDTVGPVAATATATATAIFRSVRASNVANHTLFGSSGGDVLWMALRWQLSQTAVGFHFALEQPECKRSASVLIKNGNAGLHQVRHLR
jgi:hypothetical protein